MKKRLRKKKHLGEFAVLGVSIRVRCHEGTSEAAFDELFDAFLFETVESAGLSFGGSGSAASGFTGVIEPPEGSLSIDSAVLDFIRGWLSEQPAVASVELSEPWDLWHGRAPM